MTREELAKHSTPENAWLLIGKTVYDVSKFNAMHPGGSKIMTDMAGKDASEVSIGICMRMYIRLQLAAGSRDSFVWRNRSSSRCTGTKS